MMALPISFSFEAEIDKSKHNLEEAHLINEIKCFIERNKGIDIQILGNKLTFKVSFWGMSFDYFGQIEKGSFEIAGNKLLFKFYMVRMLIIILIMALLMAYETNEIWVGALCFITLYGGNLLTALIKYKRLVVRLSSGTAEEKKNIM
ncbi:hypothetical protein [Pontibacter mangrovi]|uniref:Uncharacterized protein n=1 Tax=Pontibacter mangrovi TaxID=2589816 RepID=A0A501W3Y8_9BACT|nr:hypothetical protein [Pontibacter mangrovi]TPE42834.1 hypothetical protein FJM65_16025 [Pontibacter mangrovi]